MNYKILFEDKDIIVCYKPPGVATQTKSLWQQDMVTLLKNYLSKSKAVQNPYLGLIHRLDQPVSGVLVFAKNKKAASILSKQLQADFFHKHYLAICSGVPVPAEGTLIHNHRKEAPFGSGVGDGINEHPFYENNSFDEVRGFPKKNNVTGLAIIEESVDNRKEKQYHSSVCREDGRDVHALYESGEFIQSKPAVLDYKVIKAFDDVALLSINLKTGRFHQIRAQFSYIGHALLGDRKYGNETSRQLADKYGLSALALCAHRLTFIHPMTGKEMSFTQTPDWIDVLPLSGTSTKI